MKVKENCKIEKHQKSSLKIEALHIHTPNWIPDILILQIGF
jgi:hypothetical protein